MAFVLVWMAAAASALALERRQAPVEAAEHFADGGESLAHRRELRHQRRIPANTYCSAERRQKEMFSQKEWSLHCWASVGGGRPLAAKLSVEQTGH